MSDDIENIVSSVQECLKTFSKIANRIIDNDSFFTDGEIKIASTFLSDYCHCIDHGVSFELRESVKKINDVAEKYIGSFFVDYEEILCNCKKNNLFGSDNYLNANRKVLNQALSCLGEQNVDF